VTKKSKRNQKDWMNEEIATLMEERKKCKDTPAYAALNKEIQAACKTPKKSG
jgi:hypothetical protein